MLYTIKNESDFNNVRKSENTIMIYIGNNVLPHIRIKAIQALEEIQSEHGVNACLFENNPGMLKIILQYNTENSAIMYLFFSNNEQYHGAVFNRLSAEELNQIISDKK